MRSRSAVLALAEPPVTDRGRPGRAAFYFDIASPWTYLAAERADRMFARLRWLPATAEGLQPHTLTSAARREVDERAERLGMPLVWPDARLGTAVGAMRVASLAEERGLGAAFVVAACRLQFCGAYDIEDPEILAEAAAAAGLDMHDVLRAAADAGRDVAIEHAGQRLVAAGADRLPVLRVGGGLFCGEERLVAASAA